MKTAIGLIAAAVLAGNVTATDFNIGISGSDRGISGFALSIGDYYHVPHREIMVIERTVPRDELTVVYFLARKAHRDPRFITDLRLRGESWWDISIRLGLDPHTLYVIDTHRHSGPPYGRAYGYHKEGKSYRLRDDEIVELVNVRFLSKYYGISADDVIDRRYRGEEYIHIDDHYRNKKMFKREERDRERYYKEERKSERGERGHGRGNDH